MESSSVSLLVHPTTCHGHLIIQKDPIDIERDLRVLEMNGAWGWNPDVLLKA